MKIYPGVKPMCETLQEAKSMVYNQENSIKQLIDPSDLIHQDIESWDNVDKELLKDELTGSMGDAWTYGINHPYETMIEELAVSSFVDDMQRVPKNDLNPEKFKELEDMAFEGYWPFDVSRDEIIETVWEIKDNIDYFHEYEQEVMFEIESAIIRARLKDL